MAKRMTRREIEERRKIKKELQKKGIIPPDKPKLNRKKFAQEVCKEWENFYLYDYGKLEVFIMAMSMLTNKGEFRNISKEELGILKLKKCAMKLYDEIEKNKNMTVKEMFEVIDQIRKL